MLKPALLAALIGSAALQPALANEAKPAGAEAGPASVGAKGGGETAKPAPVQAKSKGAKAKALTVEAKRPASKASEAGAEAKPAGGEASPAGAEAKPAPSLDGKPVADAASIAPVGRKAARRKSKLASAEARPADGEGRPASVETKSGGGVEALIAMHAKANNVPEDLVHRVVQRESRYNPRAVGRGGAMGLMQIKTATARSMGYSGSPAGLLDADTNLTYAVRYLAGAYKVANGDHSRAVGFYARGYYYDAKRKGILPALKAQPLVLEAKATAPAPDAPKTASARSSLFVPALTPYTSLDSTK